MKTISNAALLSQQSLNVKIIEKIYLYQQFDAKITGNSGNNILINTDIADDFVVGDKILVPFKDYDTELTVLDSVSDSGLTTILTDKAIDSSYIGCYIAKKIDITLKLVDKGIKNIELGIEGSQLNDFDSGSMDIVVDNSTGYFRNKTKSGLFDNGGVFWAKYLIKYKGAEDIFNWFSGLVEITDMTPDFYNKTLTIRIYGHTYELTRYPAFNVCNTNVKEFPKIGGLIAKRFIPSVNSITGIKNVIYQPFSNSKMKGITVESVSPSTLSQIKVLEFRYPKWVRWDNGPWYSIATAADTDAGKQTLSSYDPGQTAVINFGSKDQLNEFPDTDSEIWVNVKDALTNSGTSKDVSEQGMPIIKFDNGEECALKIHIQRCLTLVGGIYTDVTDKINTTPYVSADTVTVLQSNGESVILVASERFWGADFLLYNLFSSGSLSISYSLGGDSFSAPMDLANNGLVDGTSNFTKSGGITWMEAKNWALNNIVVSNEIAYKGYMIKITRNSAVGNCKIKEIKRILRAQGVNSDFLEFCFDQNKISRSETEDEIIVKKDNNNNWIIGSWYENVSLQCLLEKCLDESNYKSSNRIVDNMVINRNYNTFSIWDKVPRNNYPYNPTAMVIDFTNNYIYIATELELWRCSFTGFWEFLGSIAQNFVPISKLFCDRMWIYNNEIYLVISDHDESKEYHTVYMYKYTISNGIITYIGGYNNIFNGKNCIRNGTIRWRNVDGSDYASRHFGQNDYTGDYYGENLCLAFKQVVTVLSSLLGTGATQVWNTTMYPAFNIDNSNPNQYPEWYFIYANPYHYNDNGGGGWTTMPIGGPKFNADMGYYEVHTNTESGTESPAPFHFNFTFGQQGCLIEANNDVLGFRWLSDSNSNEYFRMCKIGSNSGHYPMYYNAGSIPMCHIYDKTNEVFYFGFTIWNDTGVGTKSHSYISKYKANNTNHAWGKVWEYDSGGGTYYDNTLNYNNGVASSLVFTGLNDAVYLGRNTKFRNIEVLLSRTAAGCTYAIEYWNGSNWVQTPYSSNLKMDLNMVSFDIPENWVTGTVNGTANLYWIRLRCLSNDGTAVNVNRCWCKEIIIWDSQTADFGANERQTPLWMCLNPNENTIHGSIFNRENSQSESYPFQWSYFVFDLNNNTMHIQHSGNNFIYDGTYLPKDFVYDSYSKKVLSCFENIRYKDRSAYIVEAVYNAGAITLNQLGVPVPNEWGSSVPLISNPVTGSIYGVTKGKDYKFWEYSKTFYPRIELAKYDGNENIYTIIKDIAQMMNCQVMIHANRKLRFVSRKSSNGKFNLEWNKNMITSKPKFGTWKHYYDAVVTSFESPFDDKIKGDEKKGFEGWMKNSLKISNPLIQNSHIAKLVTEDAYEFYNRIRMNPTNIVTILMPQLEIIDKFSIYMPKNIIDLDTTAEFLVTNISLNADKTMEVSGLEMDPIAVGGGDLNVT